MEPYKTLKYPLATEKAVRIMEVENKLVFRVDEKATKKDVKKAIEELFKVKVIKVTTLNDRKGKKAYVSLSIDTPAIDVATQLGLI
ncbi:MAG: 50S ribosomal protein L23 [Nanoarchaeota archaeon]|nr:50S ribosomal protein L23 [Nanoarchaeota archaeon]MBU1445010.1 50S ribosomal protein L23 [Nanoarchaeota archaeon]MBU2406404.1 50S ribosomal protein L23 [Nanoarchaeota archaeon]MBU2420020.1 50S ribosomal protein L23 [Nanoarchaeota archaeon]MBU2475500.1 50S ribosomal protein L23 [Nanoarchaeota archaeon]